MDIHVLASGSKGNCYVLEDDGRMLMLDCGIPMAKIKEGLKHQLWCVDSCIVSHRHSDHAKSVVALTNYGMDVYAHQSVWDNLTGYTMHRSHFAQVGMPITIWVGAGTSEYWTVEPFNADHDVPCLGFIIWSPSNEKILYLTDSATCPAGIEGLTRIMVGCNYDSEILQTNALAGEVNEALKQRILKSHASLATVMEMLRNTDLSQTVEVILLHLSDTNSDALDFQAQVERLTGVPVRIA